MLDEDGINWFMFVGIGISFICFFIVLFSFPQVSATAISIITANTEYEKMSISGSQVAITPYQMNELSDNKHHQARLYMQKGDETEQYLIRTTEKQYHNEASIKKFSGDEVVYESYWTTDSSKLEGFSNLDARSYRFTKENDNYAKEPRPTKFEFDVNDVYSEIYRDDFEWRPVKYTSRYGKDVVVYELMKMPYNSKLVPFTDYKSGKVYVVEDTGQILEIYVSHNYGEEPVTIEYYSEVVTDPVKTDSWVKQSNFE